VQGRLGSEKCTKKISSLLTGLKLVPPSIDWSASFSGTARSKGGASSTAGQIELLHHACSCNVCQSQLCWHTSCKLAQIGDSARRRS
jgi:hypothetical protein